MKKHVWGMSFAWFFFLVGTANADVALNEFFVNPPGADNGREFFELSGTANQSLANHWLLVIEGDGAAAGVIDQALSLNAFTLGSNGLFVWRDAPSGTPGAGAQVNTADFLPDIENGTNSYLLVTGFSGAVGNDLDTNNDGVLDLAPWTLVVDSIAWTDNDVGDRMYSAALGGLNIGTGVFTPDMAFRERTTGVWFFADVLDPGEFFDGTNFADATGTLQNPNSYGFDFQSTSLGNFNPSFSAVPEPSSLALASAAGLLFFRRRRT